MKQEIKKEMKNIVKSIRDWRKFKEIGLRSALSSLIVASALLLLQIGITARSSWQESLFWYPVPLNVDGVFLWVLLVFFGSSLFCYGSILMYELLFGKSISEEWLKRAEEIQIRHPETSETLYFLERGDIGLLSEWIRAFDSLKYDDNKDQLRGLLEEHRNFDQRINISEERLRRIATQLQVSSPSDDELRLPSKFRWQYYDLR
jgi:hypothetical protein